MCTPTRAEVPSHSLILMVLITLQIGLSFSGAWGLLGFAGSYGVAMDGCGNVSLYKEGGLGGGIGAEATVGIGVHVTNGNTIRDLNGPFANSSVGAGDGVAGTLDTLVGYGEHGEVVAGAGFTAGGGIGAGYSGTVTNTTLIKSGKLW